MTIRTPEFQAAIDAEYEKLQRFDPEIRDGLVARPYHSIQERADIDLRIELYNAECLRFRNFCEQKVATIIEAGEESIHSVSRTQGDTFRQELLAA